MLDRLTYVYNKRKALKKGIKYIFCINSGRAGSEYLAALLGSAPKAYSYHEPEPQMIDKYLNMVAERGLEPTFKARRIKSKAILGIVSRFPNQSFYIETNHMFIKTFYDVVLNELENISVIYLKRDFMETLHSFVQLCYFSDKNETWPKWMISPNSSTAKIKCIGEDKDLDYIDLCIAYLIDIEARAISFRDRFSQIPFYEVDINDLNIPIRAKALFEFMGLTFTPASEELIGKKINQRQSLKKKYANPVDQLDLVGRVRSYIKRGQEAEIDFPERILQYA